MNMTQVLCPGYTSFADTPASGRSRPGQHRSLGCRHRGVFLSYESAAYDLRQDMTSNMLRGAGLHQRAPYVSSYVAASRPRRSRRSLRVLSVLEKEEPSLAVPSSLSHLEKLLPPSLAPAKSQSVPAKQLSCDQGIFYYSYGANLRLETLARREVNAPLLRAPAVVCDRSVKLVFKHRGGGSF